MTVMHFVSTASSHLAQVILPLTVTSFLSPAFSWAWVEVNARQKPIVITMAINTRMGSPPRKRWVCSLRVSIAVKGQ